MNYNDKIKQLYNIDIDRLQELGIVEIQPQHTTGTGETYITFRVPTGYVWEEGSSSNFMEWSLSVDTHNVKSQQFDIQRDISPFVEINPNEKEIFVCDNELDTLYMISHNHNSICLNKTHYNQISFNSNNKEEKNQALDSCKLFQYCMRNLGELGMNRKLIFLLNSPILENNLVHNTIKPLFDSTSLKDVIPYEFQSIEKPLNQHSTSELETLIVELTETQEKISDYSYFRKYKRKQALEKYKKTFPTGIKAFDRILGGGLHCGVYSIGATTGLGKTTFATQIGENLANNGTLVLNFSLEMEDIEIYLKGERRRFYFNELGGIGVPYTNIVEEDFQKIYNSFKLHNDRMEECFEQYIKGNYKLIPTTFNYTIEELEETVKYYVSLFPQRDICIIVDYCQLLNTTEEKINLNDKLKTDRILHTLKMISDKYNLIVLNVSSLNRASYYVPIDLTSFKESGGIEYTSNYVIGLDLGIVYESRFQELGESKKDRATRKELFVEASNQIIKNVKCSILKARRGKRVSCDLTFNPIYYAFDCLE